MLAAETKSVCFLRPFFTASLFCSFVIVFAIGPALMTTTMMMMMTVVIMMIMCAL